MRQGNGRLNMELSRVQDMAAPCPYVSNARGQGKALTRSTRPGTECVSNCAVRGDEVWHV